MPPNETTEKWQILVDKVVSHDRQPHTTKEHVRETKEADFNVIVPRWVGDNLEIVRKAVTLSQQHDIRCMPWIRGSAYTQDRAKMMVWRDGVTV